MKYQHVLSNSPIAEKAETMANIPNQPTITSNDVDSKAPTIPVTIWQQNAQPAIITRV